MNTMTGLLTGFFLFIVLSFVVYDNQPKPVTTSTNKVKVYAYDDAALPKPTDLDYQPVNKELFYLTEAIYFEARGESRTGQIAVANVILNRVQSKYFPNTIEEVVNQPYQFSYTLKPHVVTDNKAWQQATQIANLVLNRDFDRTNGALYYYNPKKLSKRPSWADDRYYIKSFGNHRFYKWHKTI